MVHFTNDSQGVSSKAQKISELACTYDSLRKQLLAAATSAGSAYDSEDSRIYEQNITELCRELGQVSERLLNAAQLIEKQNKNYDNTESENVNDALRLS